MEGFLPFLFAVTFILSFFLSLAGKALNRFSHSKLEERIPDENKRARLLALLDKREEIAKSSLYLKLLFYLLFTFFACSLVGKKQGASLPYLTELGFLLSAAVILLFFEAVPRGVVRKNPEAILKGSLPLLRILHFILLPLWLVLKGSEKIAMRLLGASAKESPAEKVEEEILSAVEEGEREGVIQEEEKEMIESIIDFKDAEVSEIMVPRTDMVSCDLGESVGDAITLATEKGHSRIPVHQKNQDNITGILYVKDVLNYWVKDHEKDPHFEEIPLKDIVRKPHFVPETKKIGELLKEFQNNKFHIAIVLDEYGGTAGLITIEDILEEIVGEIEDEYDSASTEDFHLLEKGIAEMDARVHIDTLNEEMNLRLPEENGFDTIGGFVFSFLGRIPEIGERFTFNGVEFTVLDADERKVNRLKVTVQKTKEKGKEDE